MLPGHRLLAFLWNKDPQTMTLVPVLLVIGVAGQAGVIFTVISGALAVHFGEEVLIHLIFAAGLILLSAVAKLMAMQQATRAGERILRRFSLETAQRLSLSGLQTMEWLGREAMIDRLTGDLNSLSRAIDALIPVWQSILLIFFSFVILLFHQPSTMLLLLLFIVTLYLYGPRLTAPYERVNERATGAEGRVTALVEQAFDGFKELRLAREKRDDFEQAGLQPANRAVRRLRRRSGRYLLGFMLPFDLLIYGTLALIAFVFPRFGLSHGLVLVLGTMTYLIDRFLLVNQNLGLLLQGESAMDRLTAWRQTLPQEPSPRPVPGARKPKAGVKAGGFKQLALADVKFVYRSKTEQTGFSVGPIDLVVSRPEICFITGGNGSGKTTLLRLLTGLYEPTGGTIRIDGRNVRSSVHRELFSAVFTDFHLFDRLHGLEVDPEAVAALLRRFRLENVTAFQDGAFTRTTLSTGQRKRLALVTALLERRPALVFDEWTADQDPTFRDVFYTQLLPELKAAGTLVLAVTHDDRYFRHCDRLIRMERGRILSQESGVR